MRRSIGREYGWKKRAKERYDEDMQTERDLIHLFHVVDEFVV